jgi:hypothetical protein
LDSTVETNVGMTFARPRPNCASYSSVVAACRQQWQQGLGKEPEPQQGPIRAIARFGDSHFLPVIFLGSNMGWSSNIPWIWQTSARVLCQNGLIWLYGSVWIPASATTWRHPQLGLIMPHYSEFGKFMNLIEFASTAC